tara:strand:+ start:40 stop:450 length:411 start_codon:yes stop_codon:yes gene_type:complete
MNEINKKLIAHLDKVLPSSFIEKRNILLIDDEKKNLTCFNSMFRREANIFLAQNKEEALRVVKSKSIDFVFCDYRMPIDNGADILKEIIKFYPKIKRSILTGVFNSDILMEFKIKSGTTDFILKPYSEQDILTRLI